MRAHIYVLLVVLISLNGISLCHANDPILVVFQYDDRRLGLIDWSSPCFAAYSDGKIIYLEAWNRNLDSYKITDHCRDIIETNLKRVKPYIGQKYSMISGLAHFGTVIWTKEGTIGIDGDWERPMMLEVVGDALVSKSSEDSNRARLRAWRSLPLEIRVMLRQIRDFRCQESKKWEFGEVVVSLSKAFNVETPTIEWPSGYSYTWLQSGNLYDIKLLLDGRSAVDLIRKIEKGKNGMTLLFDGKPYFAQFRIRFPKDDFWVK